MTTLKLYETVAALDDVVRMLEETEGEWTDAIEAAAEQAGHDFTDKVEQVALKVIELKATAAAQKTEAERLAARAKASDTNAASLSEYLRRNLEAANTDKVKGLRVTVSLQKNPASVVAPDWDEEALRGMAMYLPQFVTRKPETFALNKRAILEAAAKGEPIPENVALIQGTSLRIR